MIYKRGEIYWYKFTWRGELIRESTRQGNPRVARQVEAAHKTALAKGEVGIRERRPVPALAEFAERNFLPYVQSTFLAKEKTRKYYEHGVKALLAHEALSKDPMDRITSEKIAGFVAKRREAGLQVSSINRELQVLRRMFYLANEWGNVEKALPKVRMLPGEAHRERVLTPEEETAYLSKARPLLREAASVLLDSGLRPEECFRLRWEEIRDGRLEIQHGKSDAARRRIPASERVAAILEMRRGVVNGAWVFPAQTRSGHIEPGSLKRQHKRACAESGVVPFPLYTLRHTCLTRWAPHMDPWTLAYLAGHRDMAITRRYVHPQEQTIREALEKTRSGHKIGHTPETAASATPGKPTVIN